MTASTISVLDLGSGNLHSVIKALEYCGAKPVLISTVEEVMAADKLILPGQGAFGTFAQAIRSQNIDSAIREWLRLGRPFFGICLGMQILFEQSEEQGPISGLSVLPGKVVRFRTQDPYKKVPHMGWNQVAVADDHQEDPLLANIPQNTNFYFVHSYYVAAQDQSYEALICNYIHPFVAAIRKDNIFATQFHPEKSQHAGLHLLDQFAQL